MPTANLVILPPTLPEGFCPADWQELVNEAVGRALVQFSSASFTTIITSITAPAATDRDKLWFNTLDHRIYQFGSGAWVSRHPVAPGALERRLYEGSTASLETYDGGAAGVVAAAAGPMWEVDTNYAGRFVLGPGTLPVSGTVVAFGDTGGVEKVILTEGELPSHTHGINASSSFGGTSAQTHVSRGDSVSDLSVLTSVATGNGEAHQNMPPYRAAYVIKRTARVYYLGA